VSDLIERLAVRVHR